ncbi:hemerythrin domain-containing protein [Nonomuraea sp. NPDC050310]|uniref:hemerythrin domain-containing protein n=1 Tax=unclassified Nonomuraea TaxID=2593643 RepID=UPI0033FD02FD
MATDVITLITSDHRKVEALFERLKTNKGDRAADVAELAALLTAHARAEEDRVYDSVSDKKAHHGVEEHKEAEVLLDTLKKTDPASPEFDGRLAELIEAVTHHVEEEESEILPALAKSMSKEGLERLGKAFKEREEEELLALRGHAAAPTKEELYEQAKEQDLPGRSQMTKEELAKALGESK